MIVVSDTSPIRALAQVDLLHLLPQLYECAYVPPAVVEELRYKRPPLKSVDVASIRGIEIRRPHNMQRVQLFSRTLDAGESEALALAVELGCKRVLMDEKKGRDAARREGMEPVGVLGILAEAKGRGLLDEVAPAVHRLRREFRFFLADEVVQRYLESIGEKSEDA